MEIIWNENPLRSEIVISESERMIFDYYVRFREAEDTVYEFGCLAESGDIDH